MWWLALTAILASPALAEPPRAVIGEAWIRLDAPGDAARLTALGLGFAEGSTQDAEGRWVRIQGRAADLDAASAAGFALRGRVADHRSPPPAAGGAYHTPEAMAAQLSALAELYPDRARLVQLGESLEDRPIMGLRLGNPDGPSWRLLGAHHGDELSSAELALAVAEALLDDDPRMPQGFLDRAEVWVIPQVNPDGVALGSRYNARDIDLNRNYSYQWLDDEFQSGAEPFSEPETRAVRALSLLEPFLAGLSMHSGAQNIGYVWNYTTADTEEEARLQALGERYRDTCTLSGFYSTNGADWYVTHGDTNDWSYGARGTLDYTLEVSNTKTPASADLDGFIQAHLPAVGAFLSAPVQLQGQVVSAETDRPLEALLTVEGQTDPFPSDPESGRFARIVDEGPLTLRVEAPGYETTWTSLEAAPAGAPAVDLTVVMVPSNLSALTATPKLLSQGARSVEVHLEGLDPLPGAITLWRPGADPVSVTLKDSIYPVPTDSLVPGPYSVLWDGGAAPRAIFAGNPTDRVQVTGAEETSDALVLTGQGFAVGARAWALWGPDRALVPLPVLSWAPQRLEVDASAAPRDEPVDILLATNGAEVAIIDALEDPRVDTAAPQDTGFIASPDTAAPDTTQGTLSLQPTCGCAGAGPSAPAGRVLWLLPLIALGRRRP